MSRDDLLATRQVADTLGIDTSTISRWVKEGRIVPVMRLPGKTGAMLFANKDVERLRTDLAAEAAS